jgi:hypothetical protein
LRLSYPLRCGGIIYGQRYNLYKDLFITPEKGASAPFASPRMEGVAVPDHLLEKWLTIARIPFQNQAGKARNDLQKAFLVSKTRVYQTRLGAKTFLIWGPGKKRRGLGFQSSLQRLQMVWLPTSCVDWQLLSFRSEILASSSRRMGTTLSLFTAKKLTRITRLSSACWLKGRG